MNTRPISILFLSVALSLSASIKLSAALKKESAFAYRVRSVTVIVTPEDDMIIGRGATREYVSHVMKYQWCNELSPDVWSYVGYHANLDSGDEHECGNLVITFVNDRVSNLQLVNSREVVEISANLKGVSTARSIARE
jgi:hypothetical protein